jgi:hypothetical protein
VREAALGSGVIIAEDVERIVDPAAMVGRASRSALVERRDRVSTPATTVA